MNPSFKLDEAIAKWRKEMTAQGVKSRDVLDELENHLREDVANQIRAGTDAAEAFKVATRRIGRGAVLKGEFAKLDGRKQWLPDLFRIYCFITGPFMLLVGGWYFWDFGSDLFGRAIGLGVISCLAICTGSLPFWYRRLPSPYTKSVGRIIKAATLLVVLVPVLALLGAFGIRILQLNHTGEMILWCVVAASCATMLAYMSLDIERGAGWSSFPCPSPDRFTDLAQRAAELAHDEAGKLGHDYVGTEHLLLGVISCDSGLLSDLLRKWGIDSDTIRAEIEKVVGAGAARKSARDFPYTPRAKRALGLAMQEVRAMGHSFISPEHMMLGLLLEKEGVAGMVLRGLGINADRARRDILNGMGPGGDDGFQPVLA